LESISIQFLTWISLTVNQSRVAWNPPSVLPANEPDPLIKALYQISQAPNLRIFSIAQFRLPSNFFWPEEHFLDEDPFWPNLEQLTIQMSEWTQEGKPFLKYRDKPVQKHLTPGFSRSEEPMLDWKTILTRWQSDEDLHTRGIAFVNPEPFTEYDDITPENYIDTELFEPYAFTIVKVKNRMPKVRNIRVQMLENCSDPIIVQFEKNDGASYGYWNIHTDSFGSWKPSKELVDFVLSNSPDDGTYLTVHTPNEDMELPASVEEYRYNSDVGKL
jgi:hypothetical protein